MKLIITQIIIACMISSLMLTVFKISMWEYWVSLVLIIANQTCFAVVGIKK